MRDKLIELIKEADSIAAQGIKEGKLHTDGQSWAAFGDHLIANGVTVQEWINPIEYYPSKNEIILIHDIRGNTYVGPSINTPVDKVGYWMPLPQPPNCGADMRE